MLRILFLIGFGGFFGSVARYLISQFFTKNISSEFPYGTFAVNVLGCLIIGLIYGFSERFNWSNPEFRLLLATGFCGGFTTFSAFAYENIKLLQTSNYLTFGIYSLSSFVLCLISVYVGLQIAKI
jgi:CrcB protein